jgi:quercetin dioxygenase-like cupin family protein
MTQQTTDALPLTALYRPADSAPATWAMGSLFEHLLNAADSGGALGMALVTQPPGIATPLHRHTREAEAFFLLDGSMTYRAGNQMFPPVHRARSISDMPI